MENTRKSSRNLPKKRLFEAAFALHYFVCFVQIYKSLIKFLLDTEKENEYNDLITRIIFIPNEYSRFVPKKL